MRIEPLDKTITYTDDMCQQVAEHLRVNTTNNTPVNELAPFYIEVDD